MMKLLYAILIVLSLATQGVATRLLSESEGSAQPVAKTEGVTQESALSRWVGNAKTTAFWVAGITALPLLVSVFGMLINNQPMIRHPMDFFFAYTNAPYFYSSCIGLWLWGVETVLKRGRNLYPNWVLAREIMIALPAVMCLVNHSVDKYAIVPLSTIPFLFCVYCHTGIRRSKSEVMDDNVEALQERVWASVL